jgi:EmrB/QacA subfamily drug resistance transporter
MHSRPANSLAAFVVAGAFFMELFDGTVITTALPKIAESFHVGAVNAGLGVTAYLLTVAVMIPLSGWLSDRFGARPVFCTAIGVFTAASVLCAVSQSLPQFVAARVLQGIGGAMMVPVGRTVVLRGSAKKDLMKATAILTWPALAAPVLGPPIGGLITTYSSWRWVFGVNVPLGLAGLTAALLLVKATPVDRRPFDGLGFGLSALAIAALVYGLNLTGGQDVDWPLAGGLIAAGLAVGAVAVRHLLRHPTPIVDLAPLRITTYATTSWEGSLLRLAINMVPFLLPLLFQVGFGLSAVTSGLLVLSLFAGNLVMKSVATPLMRRFGFRRVLVGNGILVAVSLTGCALFTAGTPMPVIVVVCFASGAFRSLEFTAINTLAFADVPPAGMSAASTLNAAITQLAIGLGVAIAATMVNVAAGGHPPSAGDFRLALALAALISLVGSLRFLRLSPSAGAEVSGRPAVAK